jgi:hypothetical protein
MESQVLERKKHLNPALETTAKLQMPSLEDYREWKRQLRGNAQREMLVFERMLPSLLKDSKGVFVAIAGGELVDRDESELLLAQRVAKTHHDRFVLIRQVSASNHVQYHLGF